MHVLSFGLMVLALTSVTLVGIACGSGSPGDGTGGDATGDVDGDPDDDGADETTGPPFRPDPNACDAHPCTPETVVEDCCLSLGVKASSGLTPDTALCPGTMQDPPP